MLMTEFLEHSVSVQGNFPEDLCHMQMSYPNKEDKEDKIIIWNIASR